MSTKIYVAYRMPIRCLNGYIGWAREKMTAAAQKTTRTLMESVDQEKLGTIPDHIAGNEEGEAAWEEYKRMEVVMAVLKGEANSPYRSGIDPSCSLNIWLHDGMAYVMPIGERHVVEPLEAGLKEWAWLQEYGYWDNTDAPEGISATRWNLRGKKWLDVCCGEGESSHNARRLHHEVVEIKTAMGAHDFEWGIGRERMTKWADDERIAFQVKKAEEAQNG